MKYSERQSVVTLEVIDDPNIIELIPNTFLFSQRLANGQASLIVRQRLRIIALLAYTLAIVLKARQSLV